VEPKESAGSFWLKAHVFNNLGIHLKSGLYCNQRCQFQLVLAFFLVNSLVLGLFLDLFCSIMGVTTISLEIVDGGFPNIDLEAIVGLKGMHVLRFL
jgi:hypothetical protein